MHVIAAQGRPRYFARLSDDRLGPFTAEELAQLRQDGALPPGTALEEESGGPVRRLEEVLPDAPSAGIAVPTLPPAPQPGASPAGSPPLAVDVGGGFPVWRWIWTVLLGASACYLLFRRPTWFPLDGLNFIFHEAGHLIFSFCGEFLTILGGTISQLAIPALVAGYFLRARRMAGLQFGLFWLGQSCLDVSRYVADASRLELEVWGGDHDWNHLLYDLGLLEKDAAIAGGFVAAAAVFFLLMVAAPFFMAPPAADRLSGEDFPA
ncbi:MAG: hypothetical protein ACM3XS_01455 [Bacteroidota bacterium]